MIFWGEYLSTLDKNQNLFKSADHLMNQETAARSRMLITVPRETP